MTDRQRTIIMSDSPQFDQPQVEAQPPTPALPPRPRRVLLPIVLFLATCYTTLQVGGPAFAIPLMIILLCHEFGHFLQAERYRVPASLPYFIPVPGSLIGTMGAVIVMQPGMGNRRSLFDIGITGPLAGLVPALMFSIVGLSWSEIVPTPGHGMGLTLGEPLIFKILAYFVLGPNPAGTDIALHPVAFAGWVGIFITALNLFPIGQLDGGHVLYALLLKRAYPIAQAVLLGVMLGVIWFGYWGWSLMILLLMLMGPIHPPTANDQVPLGTGRTILGWASLLFVPLGFTPVPFSFGM
jgi:membrane-associated protease RseP (regulator of RpoE activity)